MKNNRAFSLLLTANTISGFAQGISVIAIPWYFSNTLHAMSTFGLIYAVVTFCTLFWTLYTGTLIDKYSRKNVFLCINTVGGIVLGAAALYGYTTGEMPIYWIALVFTATVFVFNVHYPALYAFGQEITEKENYGRMNSVLEIQVQATMMLSGAMAAILLSGTENKEMNLLGFSIQLPFEIRAWELYEIFLLDASTYIVAIALIALIKYKPLAIRTPESGSAWSRMLTGFRFLKKHPLTFLFGNASYAIFAVLVVEATLLMAPYVSSHLGEGASIFASAEVCYSLGAVIAGVVINRVFRHTHTVKAIIILMAITGVGLYLCTFTKSTLYFYLFSIIIGITNAGTRILRVTYLFNHIPNDVIGRASSVYNVLNIMLRTSLIGLFSLPMFADNGNVIWGYFVCATFVLLWIIPMLVRYKSLSK